MKHRFAGMHLTSALGRKPTSAACVSGVSSSPRKQTLQGAQRTSALGTPQETSVKVLRERADVA